MRKEQWMAKAAVGCTVKVHYTGSVDDGTVFDSSEQGEPLEFTIGNGELIPGFEQGVIGMEVGETKTVKIPATEAYGSRMEELVRTVPRTRLPPGVEPKIGAQLRLNGGDGQYMAVTITEVSESSVTLDGNHPLAGKDLTFALRLVEASA
jgi:peptidylprolyl isomerase